MKRFEVIRDLTERECYRVYANSPDEAIDIAMREGEPAWEEIVDGKIVSVEEMEDDQ